MARHGGRIVAEFTDLPDRPSVLDIAPIARTVIEDFLAEDYDEVYLAYTEFHNTLTQKPALHRLLPITPGEMESSIFQKYIDDTGKINGEYIYEPNPETILGVLLPDFTEMQIYQAVLESFASEHSARMVSMRNATDNAHALIDHLTLQYYRARQEAITNEMVDIAGGVEALRASAT
jgi:F-type H+-transporting ATPase subunit gamma